MSEATIRWAVGFRVDAGPRLGIGHLTRCLALADALAAAGARCQFVTGALPPDLAHLVRSRGHQLATFDQACGDRDVARTGVALGIAPVDWIVVDHYALGAAWEQEARAFASHVLAIDDLADRPHDCDVLLDQNLLPDADRRYRGKVPADCTVLTGPRYALLRPEYAAARGRRRRDGSHRVLVFFGGSDPFGLTARAVTALHDPRVAGTEADVVCGTAVAATLEQRGVRDGIRIHGPRPHLADLMAAADLGVGAAGSTSWERLCVGLFAIVVTVAENQVEVAHELSRRGLVRFAGAAAALTERELATLMAEELGRDHREAEANGMSLCDGHGASRVAATMRTHV